MELAVIGNGDFVTGFRLAGIRKVYKLLIKRASSQR